MLSGTSLIHFKRLKDMMINIQDTRIFDFAQEIIILTRQTKMCRLECLLQTIVLSHSLLHTDKCSIAIFRRKNGFVPEFIAVVQLKLFFDCSRCVGAQSLEHKFARGSRDAVHVNAEFVEAFRKAQVLAVESPGDCKWHLIRSELANWYAIKLE